MPSITLGILFTRPARERNTRKKSPLIIGYFPRDSIAVKTRALGRIKPGSGRLSGPWAPLSKFSSGKFKIFHRKPYIFGEKYSVNA